MKIAEAAEAAGLTAKTLRYYEDEGLVVPARDTNGYRVYSGGDVARLSFIHRARDLGFSLGGCRQLLSLQDNEGRASADVKQLAQVQLSDVKEKIRQLTKLETTLSHLIDECAGDASPHCAILDALADQT